MSYWIAHEGGECPVKPSTRVEVCRRKPGLFDGGEARFFSWEHMESDYDIVAYRVVPPAPVDREFRRAVFLAVLPQVWAHSRTVEETERAISHAWHMADEAIAQEGA